MHERDLVTALVEVCDNLAASTVRLSGSLGCRVVPFLDDAARNALNQRRGQRDWVLTSVDRWGRKCRRTLGRLTI